MTDEDLKESSAMLMLRAAVFHLASCWDCLSAVESECDVFIEVNDISSFAGDVVDPDDAMHIDDSTVREWLDLIKKRMEKE